MTTLYLLDSQWCWCVFPQWFCTWTLKCVIYVDVRDFLSRVVRRAAGLQTVAGSSQNVTKMAKHTKTTCVWSPATGLSSWRSLVNPFGRRLSGQDLSHNATKVWMQSSNSSIFVFFLSNWRKPLWSRLSPAACDVNRLHTVCKSVTFSQDMTFWLNSDVLLLAYEHMQWYSVGTWKPLNLGQKQLDDKDGNQETRSTAGLMTDGAGGRGVTAHWEGQDSDIWNFVYF